MTRPAASSSASGSSGGGRRLSRLGLVLVALGAALLLVLAYELVGTGVVQARSQHGLARTLERQWAGPAGAAAPVPQPGQPFVALHLPGRAPLVVVEGVGRDDLRRGPGHLPGSAAPGQPGNVVLSGHRTTYGAPFGDLDRLRPGDEVVLETREGWSTYRITGTEVVSPRAVDVTWPVPRTAGAAPTRALLTLTTCTPRWTARSRLVVRGLLEQTRPRVLAPGMSAAVHAAP